MANTLSVIRLSNLQEAREEISKVGADPGGVQKMAAKAVHFCVRVPNLSTKACNILKQEMLSLGGDAAVHKHVVDAGIETSDVLLMGTVKQYRLLIPKLKAQPFGLRKLAEEIQEILASPEITGKNKINSE